MKYGILTIILSLSLLLFLPSCGKRETERYPNGQLKVERHFKGGKLEGKFRLWYENGTLMQEAFYLYDQ